MPPAKTSVAQRAICSRCISVNPAGASTCGNCGAPLTNAQDVEPQGAAGESGGETIAAYVAPPEARKPDYWPAPEGIEDWQDWQEPPPEPPRAISIVEQGYQVVQQVLAQSGAPGEQIEIVVASSDPMTGSASSCAVATNVRVITLKAMGNQGPLVNGCLWQEVHQVQWVENRNAVTVIMLTREGGRLAVEDLPTEQAQALVKHAIDYGDRVNITQSRATPSPPAAASEPFPTSSRVQANSFITSDLFNYDLAGSVQQPVQAQPPSAQQAPVATSPHSPQAIWNGEAPNVNSPSNSVVHGLMRDTSQGNQTGTTAGLQSKPSAPPAASTPPPKPAGRPGESLLRNVMKAQVEEASESSPLFSGPLAYGSVASGPLSPVQGAQAGASYHQNGYGEMPMSMVGGGPEPGAIPHAQNGTEAVWSQQAQVQTYMPNVPNVPASMGVPEMYIAPTPGPTHTTGRLLAQELELQDVTPFVPPATEGFSSGPLNSNPLNSNPLNSGPLNADPFIPPRPRKPVQMPPTQEDPMLKLKQLRDMLEAGLITSEDFERKKADILSRF